MSDEDDDADVNGAAAVGNREEEHNDIDYHKEVAAHDDQDRYHGEQKVEDVDSGVHGKYGYNSVENTKMLKYKYTFSGTQVHRKYEYNSVQTRAKLSTLLTSILILKIEKKSLSKPINIGLGSSFEDLDAKTSKIKIKVGNLNLRSSDIFILEK
jgi:hypothetical protein